MTAELSDATDRPDTGAAVQDNAGDVQRRARAICVEAGFPDTTTPLVDAWYTLNKDRRDSLQAKEHMPGGLWVDLTDWGSTGQRSQLVASVRIGGYTFTHELDDMRLLLHAAIEWLDRRVDDLAAPEATS